MSKKWSSSKKVIVNGVAFKRARLMFKSQDEELNRGEYGEGSQEWLAEQARVSLRTVNELEAGRATLKTVDAISNILIIKGREFIQGYGADFTTFRATGAVDFRPTINGRVPGNEARYLESTFLVTIDPIVITVDDDFIDTAKLKGMELKLSVGSMEINFSSLYNVTLTSRAQTWLGDEEDVSEVSIFTREPFQQSVMFRQASLERVTWGEFITHLNSTSDGRILLKLKLVFEHFEKTDHIMVAVEELKTLFEMANPKGAPYWVQPRALMI
jgi:hypothetical protein